MENLTVCFKKWNSNLFRTVTPLEHFLDLGDLWREVSTLLP